MLKFNAEKYVKDNAWHIPLTDRLNIGQKIRCIDDRAPASDDKKYPIAIPGAGLGIVMDTIGGITLLRRKGKHVSFEASEILDIVEKILGVVTYHTDDKSVRNKGNACGGCNHANGSLVDPIRCLISEIDAGYFLDKGLVALKEKLKARGLKPEVYKGRHSAKAVMIIEAEATGLPSTGILGEHVFVYHKSYHEFFLRLIARELAIHLVDHSQGVSADELESALLQSAKERFDATPENFAPDVLRFRVSDESRIFVEQIK